MKKKILICIMLLSFCFLVFPCTVQAIANTYSNSVLKSKGSSLVLASNKAEVKITAKDYSSVKLSEELLKNTGFEEDYTATGEWISYASGQFERTMETAHSGKYSVKVYDRDAYWNGVAQDITEILKNNGQGKYKYSAWVKTENLDQTMVLGLILYDDAVARHGYSVKIDATNDQWVYLSGEADITWTGELSNSIVLLEGGEGQTLTGFYVDDVSLKKIVDNTTDTPISNESEAGVEELSEELMKNTGFEEDYTATGEWVSYASGQFERSKEAAHSGKWGAKVYDRDAYWNGISQEITGAFKEKGQGEYIFSVWAKTEKLDQKIVVYIFCWNTDKKRYVYSAEGAAAKDGWTQVTGKADIQWEGELDEIILLVVTGEEKEAASFYVDDFSLKKIGGVSKNPNIGIKEDQPTVTPKLPKDQVKVYPKESLELLNTPYKGYYTYGEGDPFQWVTESVWNYLSVGYLRTNWKDLEPEEGQYNWKFIEECIDECKKHNAALAIAFMPVNVSSDTWGVQSTPEWVFKAGAKYTVQQIKRPSEIIDIKVPVWDDPVYMEKLQRFITALKNKYDDRPEIAHFDIRNYGNWGEWHLGRLTGSKEISLDAKKKHIDMWKDFKKPVLIVSNSSTSSMEKEVSYAVNQYNFGVRRDGCMHPFASSNHKVLANCYDKAPSAMEWWGDYSSWGPNGEFKDQAGILPILFERTVTEGKISFVPLSKWESEAWCKEQKRLVEYWYNRIGYWLKLTEISYPANICAGAITLRVKNDGVAPIYPNHKNIGYVKIAILDSKNNILDSKTLEGINPYHWKPGVYKEEYATYDFGANKKAKKLAIGVFTEKNLEKPDVQLGIQAERVDNWYILNSMPKKEDKVVSANKLYAASKEYADSGYGFRWAEYAFDNDEKTFWSTGASNEDSWLQIDFGCEKTVSEVYLKEASKNAKGFKIQCYDGSNWLEMKSGTSIGTKGKTLSFTPRKARLLRICFNAVAGGIQISECKVYSKAN